MAVGWSWLNPLTLPMEPWVLLGVEVTAILYIWGGYRRSQLTTSFPSGGETGWGPSRWRSVAFWSALAVLVFALDTPLEWLALNMSYPDNFLYIVVVPANSS